MKVLKVIFYIVLVVAFVHLLFHIYFLSTPYGSWFNANGSELKIESLEYDYVEIHNQSVLLDKSLSENTGEVSGNSFNMFGLNGRAEYDLGSDTTETWYRCPLCYPTHYYAYLTVK